MGGGGEDVNQDELSVIGTWMEQCNVTKRLTLFVDLLGKGILVVRDSCFHGAVGPTKVESIGTGWHKVQCGAQRRAGEVERASYTYLDLVAGRFLFLKFPCPCANRSRRGSVLWAVPVRAKRHCYVLSWQV